MNLNKQYGLILFAITIMVISCGKQERPEGKLNQVNLSPEDEYANSESNVDPELQKILARLPLKPNRVLTTFDSSHKLIPLYKEKYSDDGKIRYIDGTYFHRTYDGYYDSYQRNDGNAWHGHFMPGLEAAYGFKMYNIAHYNMATNQRNEFFPTPVLVKTIYFPSAKEDTLNFKPVSRNYYLISVYNEDTNNDTVINTSDLRRIFFFDTNGENPNLLIPENYSVIKSQYESENDLMYIFAKLDENNNGSREKEEPIHIFVINLKEPKPGIRIY